MNFEFNQIFEEIRFSQKILKNIGNSQIFENFILINTFENSDFLNKNSKNWDFCRIFQKFQF